MASRSFRNRLGESTNIWPGFVDVLATLLIVIIFVLMIFTVSQIYLSDAISGRDKALQELRIQISELSKILQSEVSEKEEVLDTLSETESLLSGVQSDLLQQELITEGLQTDLAKKNTEIFVQEQNILALSGQVTELLSELRIVAKALEVYEGLDSANLDALAKTQHSSYRWISVSDLMLKEDIHSNVKAYFKKEKNRAQIQTMTI